MEVLYLVRHGETEWNRERRMQGRLDSSLTEAGRQHARDNGVLLAREGAEHLLVSPLGRTRETARLIREQFDVDATYDGRLMERHCGAWQGLTTMEIERRFPQEWLARARDPYFHRPPGGENLPDLVQRIAPLTEQLHELPYRRLAIVAHGISGRALLVKLLGLSPAEAGRVRQPNDLVYRLTFARDSIACAYFRAGAGPQSGLFTVAPDQMG